MQIRYAGTQDIPGLDRLLSQVLTVHHNGRPDLFRANARKYNDDELKERRARFLLRMTERAIS